MPTREISDRKYTFQLKAGLPIGQRLNCEQASHSVNLSQDCTFEIQARNGKTIANSTVLAFVGRGFDTAESALESASNLRYALMLTAVRLFYGFRFGQGQEIIRYGERQPKEKDGAMKYESENLDDIGLTIFEGDIPKTFKISDLSLTNLEPLTRFENVLKRAFNRMPQLSDSQTTALELINLASFESSDSAKFLSLISALEILSERTERETSQLSLVNNFLSQLNESNLSSTAKKKLVGGLRDLKRISISEACQTFVHKHLGPESAARVRMYYKYRGHLVHSGKLPSSVDIHEEQHSLRRVVLWAFIGDIFDNDIFEEDIVSFRQQLDMEKGAK